MAIPNKQNFKDLFNKSIFAGFKQTNKQTPTLSKNGFLKSIQDKIQKIQTQIEKK